jgi:hypothetical protein
MSQQLKVIDTGYVPRKQLQNIHANKKRFNVTILHRRAGKTLLWVNDIIDEAIRNPLLFPHYFYVAPTYGAAKQIAWEYFKYYAKNIPFVEFKEGELKVVIKRPKGMMPKYNFNALLTDEADEISIWLCGADNAEAKRGVYADGIMLDEYSEMNPVVYSQTFRPALSDRNKLSILVREKYGVDACRESGWAVFSGTPKGSNHLKEMYDVGVKNPETWFTALLPVSHTKLISDSELESMKQTMGEDEFQQEMMCSFTAALTSFFFSNEMNLLASKNKITSVPYNPAYPVSTFWDLGISDDTAIWFIQKIGTSYHAIDYMSSPGKGIDWWIKEIHKKPYNYAKHYLPHDAAKRDFMTAKPLIEQVEQAGLRPVIMVSRVKRKQEAISQIRLILPLMTFDAETCYSGVECLKNYRREKDSENDIYKTTPVHNWASHGVDAFATFACGVSDSSFMRTMDLQDIPTQAIIDYDEFGKF